jgi:hypothetical protein
VTTSPDAPSRPATTRARWFAAELTMATEDVGPVHEAVVERDLTTERDAIVSPFAPSDER